VRGDVGGFGISSSQSKLTWNLIACADYRFARWRSVFAGYRVMDIELEGESGHFATDLQMSGAVLGLNLHF
jgi:hypothetical protein